MSELLSPQLEKTFTTDFQSVQFELQKKYLESPDLAIAPFKNTEQLLLQEVTTQSLMGKVRFFRLQKFVYEKDVKVSYKLKSVFTALHSIEATLISKIISDGNECEILIGVKSAVNVSEKAAVMKGALQGNFPGTLFSDGNNPISNQEVLRLNNTVLGKCAEITAVVGIPSLKDKEEDQFIQGIENLILGMNGKPFSALFIADPVAGNQVDFTLDAYEQIYSVLSGDKEFIQTQGSNYSMSFTENTSTSHSVSSTVGTNSSVTTNASPWIGRKFLNGVFGTGSKNADSIAKKIENGVDKGANYLDSKFGEKMREKQPSSVIKADLKTKTDGSKTKGDNHSETDSETDTRGESRGTNTGSSSSLQNTFTNKKISNFLDRLEGQMERLQQGRGIGFWNVGAYFISDCTQNSVIAANIYNGLVKGAESNFEVSAIKTYSVLNEQEQKEVIEYLKRYEIPSLSGGRFLAQAVTTDELVVQMNFPHKSLVGLDVVQVAPFGNNPPKKAENCIKIGQLYNYDQTFSNEIALDYNKFTSHIFVTGSTGSGKSNVTYNLLDKLYRNKIKFLVIEPAKGEYKDEFGGRNDVKVYGTNPKYTSLLRINPFAFPPGIHIYEHIDRFIEILNACWPMEAAMPNLLKEAVEEAYMKKGWLLVESRSIYDNNQFPTFSDLLQALEEVIKNSKFSAEVKSNYEGALLSRVRSMTNGLNKLIFTEDYIADEGLFDQNVIVDLSRVASSEGKALFMGLIFMKLNEYRIATKSGNNSTLKHVTVIEEAHNLLKRTSSDQSADSANLAGKSVEMISNAIAEMRTYGEGFIIADQAPGLLDMSVIRNTNTKICLRLPDFEDRKLVGNAMNLSEEQIKELASLETGVAAVYQNDWQEAILCKFERYQSKNDVFTYHYSGNNDDDIKKGLEIINKYFLREKITNQESNFVLNTFSLDFILKQPVDESRTLNAVKIKYLKIIRSITNLKIDDAEKILRYLVDRLIESDHKGKITQLTKKL